MIDGAVKFLGLRKSILVNKHFTKTNKDEIF